MSKIANMEISFIKFNERVLDMARDSNLSINKRLDYIRICQSNMDEFISVRIGNIKHLKLTNPSKRSIDGLLPKEESRLVYQRLKEHYADIENAYNEILNLTDMTNKVLNLSDILLSEIEIEPINSYFEENIYPLLSVFKLNRQTDVPFIANGEIALFAKVKGGNLIIPIPSSLPRHYKISDERFLRIEDVITLFLEKSYNIEVEEILTYRTIKSVMDGNIYDDNSHVNDVKAKLEKRKHGEVMLFEITPCTDDFQKRFMKAMNIGKKKVVQIDNVRKTDCVDLKLNTNEVKHKPAYVKYKSMLKTIEKEDVIFQHPYDSIQYVLDFLEESAVNPDVTTIRQTVYRLSKNSPLMKSLLKAISNGKDVTVVFEVTAQFDEANNMYWAKKILEAGGNVVYGVQDKKVHCKVMLVTKREKDGSLTNFAHIGTCNYNELNSAFFSDLSFFTSNKTTCKDIIKLFNSITSTTKQNFESILSGPFVAKKALLAKIDKEIEVAKSGGRGYICGKMNALQDVDMINKFYEASEAGVKIDLIVRGLCSLKTNESYSENITVKSIVGEFLEHSRLYYFDNDKHKLYMGTADLMQRNLEGRFEILTPFLNKYTYKKMLGILNSYLGNCNSYFLKGESYEKHIGDYNVHEYFKK